MAINAEVEFGNDEQYGRGAWWQDRFIYWRKSLSRSAIVMDKFQRRLDKALNILVWLIVVLGYLALAVWIFLNFEALFASPLKLLLFWQERHPLILIFLFSSFFDLFLVYRLIMLSREHYIDGTGTQ